MEEISRKALKGIRALFFEIIKGSDEQDRRFTIEDSGSYCDLKLTIRVLDPNIRKTLMKSNLDPSELIDDSPRKDF